MATEARPQVIIRTAVEADIPILEAFITPFVEEGKLLHRTFDELTEWLANFFVAELDGELVGCAALEIYSKKLAEIRSLAVSNKVQGMGIGKRLVEACLERAKEKNIFEVMAITSSDNFFISCGFDFTLPGEKKALFIQTRERH
ncbi:MAG: GNAT family N-acetyltransferase [Anaerolineaceae bacterium]|nr:GNAT family N-acetyltransferase [Anaerolineaceae bacterium]